MSDKIRKIDVKRHFVNDWYGGDWIKYREARKADYWKVQQQWACYIDMLCRNGEITQKTYDTVEF